LKPVVRAEKKNREREKRMVVQVSVQFGTRGIILIVEFQVWRGEVLPEGEEKEQLSCDPRWERCSWRDSLPFWGSSPER